MSKYICARCLVSTLSLRSTTANDAYEEFLLHSWQMAKLTKPYNFQQQHVYLHPKYGSGYNGESTKSPAWHVITLGFSRYSNKNRTRMLSPHFRHVQMAENYCSQNSSIWMSHPVLHSMQAAIIRLVQNVQNSLYALHIHEIRTKCNSWENEIVCTSLLHNYTVPA